MQLESEKDKKTYETGKALMSRNYAFWGNRLNATAQIAEIVCHKEFKDNRDRIICAEGVNARKKAILERESLDK